MIKTKDFIFDQLQKCLTYYGFPYKIRQEDGEECITIGDNRSDRKRVKISVDDKTNGINISVGLDMGDMYTTAAQSEYKSEVAEDNSRGVFLSYPEPFLATDFIRDNSLDPDIH